jgi:hypothetical protein
MYVSKAAKETVWMKKFITKLDWFIKLLIYKLCNMITMEVLHKIRNQDLIKDPNMFIG